MLTFQGILCTLIIYYVCIDVFYSLIVMINEEFSYYSITYNSVPHHLTVTYPIDIAHLNMWLSILQYHMSVI